LSIVVNPPQGGDMQRRGESGQAVKGQRPRTIRPKAREAPTAPGSTDHSAEQFDLVKHERDEALEQLAATSEVLQIMGSSCGELDPVFRAMLEKATNLCGATFGNMYLHKGDAIELAATYNSPPALVEERARAPYIRKSGSPHVDKMVRTKRAVHIIDLASDEAYFSHDPRAVTGVELGGVRTLLLVPMLKDAEVVGHFAIIRQEVRPFTERQIDLVKNFAAQAVIAIENTRLLNELRQRTADLSESLEQQTATSEVLRVISRSPGELEPVFQSMLEKAVQICNAKFGILFLTEGDAFRTVALYGAPPAYADVRRRDPVIRPGPETAIGRASTTKQPVQVVDAQAEPAYYSDPSRADFLNLTGVRTTIAVPMVKEDELVGVILIYRQEVRPFTEKQIGFFKNFAAQAVIAIENTRLLNELRESLQQQTATADVLKVISRSAFNLQTVLDTLVESAARLCDADSASIHRTQEEAYPCIASYGLSPEFQQYLRDHPIVRGRGSVLGRVVSEGKTIHVPDVLADAEHALVEQRKRGGYRTVLGVPLRREGDVIGLIRLTRNKVQPFTDKQIDLVTTFADQAVIAIENVRLFEEVQARTRDLSESLQQQTATADVLKVISASPGQLEPVFDAMLENAVRICDAKFGNLWLREGDTFRIGATHGAPPAYADLRRREPVIHFSLGVLSRIIATKQPQHITDLKTEQTYIEREPGPVGLVEKAGARTVLLVPMLKDNEVIGIVAIYRQEVRPFTDKQIELVKNFAAQAVIAIENTRLLNELRQRTDDLSESLEQQTATSEVLQTISRSPGDLQPVFETMLENAVRICDAKFGKIRRWDGEVLHLVATHNAPSAFADARRHSQLRPTSGTPIGRMVAAKTVIHVADLAADQGYIEERSPSIVAAVELEGVRTILYVPMLKETELIGAFTLSRQEVRPFTSKQIELVTNFAAQAVIATENARLLNELRQRTDDLSESLEQQTATSEVLRVISSSEGELEPVFQTMLANATRICEAAFGSMLLSEGELFRRVATHNAPPMFAEFHQNTPIIDPRKIPDLKVIVETKRPVHVVDAAAVSLDAPIVKYAGARSLLVVPLLKEGDLLGAIGIYRQEVRPFTDKQIELVTNFAAQAVIAIENARLLNELRESLQQQTATADVLKVISRSTFDLQTVLDTLLDSAIRLCGTDRGMIFRYDGDSCRAVAARNFPSEFLELWERTPIRAGRATTVGRALLERRPVQIVDVKADPEYAFDEAQKMFAFRTVLAVPMLREGTPKGVIALVKTEVEPFTDKQIALVETFADQAAIAIENVRLFESVEARTRELAASLENLRTTQDRLVQTQKLASLGQLTAGIAHEIKNPLNFVNNFSGISAELITELQEALADVSLNEKRRSEITELMDILRGNLDKVVQHGKRADAIVKNMLLHSREGSGEHRPVDINALVEESLNLAYHGARAEKQGFNITMERSLDPDVGQADVFPQDITRVLLNLISNGFYAATRRRAEADGDDYEPTLVASTRSLGDRVEIRVRDNGAGIPPEVKEKMFNPFFTTKPAGEGTGLGLSICHDIIVKQHGGSIEVDTKPGEFTEITVILPRTAVFI
jgi:GAF domain-containing protein